MDNDLQAMLERRKRINRGQVPAPTANATSAEEKTYRAVQRSFNVFQEFPGLGMNKIKECEQVFRSHDSDHKGYLNLEDCKKLMEHLKRPQTHLGLKRLVREATENEKTSQQHPPNTLSFYGFLTLYQDAEDEENLGVACGNGVQKLAKQDDIDVATAGVSGAKNFFTAKIVQENRVNQAEREIRQAQAQRKQAEEVAKQRKSSFRSRISQFDNNNA